MNLRVVHLIEHRGREVRLPPGDVAFLLAHARPFVEVVPSFRRGVYRLTARGVVGRFDTPTRRLSIRPKIPWPNVRMLLGLTHADTPAGDDSSPDADLLDVLALEFASQLRDVTGVGLISDYRERDGTGPFLRGKLRTADQLRDAAARAFPDRFHFTESVLDIDTPWNRILRCTADALLSRSDLGGRARTEIRDASLSLSGVPLAPITEADFATAAGERRVEHYRELLALSRVLHDGLGPARLVAGGGRTPSEAASGTNRGVNAERSRSEAAGQTMRGVNAERSAFLINLSRAFERYLATGLAAALAPRSAWRVEAHPEFPLGPTSLQPDLLIRRRGVPRVVLDCKWKAPCPAPAPDDLHQILAYAAVTGARHVGLVYPGRRFAARKFTVPGSDITVSLFRVRVTDTVEECDGSLRRLGAAVARGRL